MFRFLGVTELRPATPTCAESSRSPAFSPAGRGISRPAQPAGRDSLAPSTILMLSMYYGTLVHMDDQRLVVERVQTGVRMEKRLLKVLKAFAEYHDMTLGDLLEGIVLHAFDGKTPFSPASLERIQELKRFYDFDLDSSASHRLKEIKARPARKRTADK
jgi:hypothetical protein